jgi:hypothetical protein
LAIVHYSDDPHYLRLLAALERHGGGRLAQTLSDAIEGKGEELGWIEVG